MSLQNRANVGKIVAKMRQAAMIGGINTEQGFGIVSRPSRLG